MINTSKFGPIKKLPDLKLSHTYKPHKIKHPSVQSVATHRLGQESKILKIGETKRNKAINVIQK